VSTRSNADRNASLESGNLLLTFLDLYELVRMRTSRKVEKLKRNLDLKKSSFANSFLA
jgi:hypothetical protein